MKLTTFFLFVLLFQVSAGVFSQNNGRFSLKAANESINNILKLIEDETDYTFMYNRNNIDVERKTDINMEVKNIEEVLDKLFKGTNVRYRSFNRNYVLYTEGEASPVPSQQSISISGKVTDSSGAPLPGVTVVIKGSNMGTVTGVDGSYNLAKVSGSATLIFSFVGMKAREIPVAGKAILNVVMEEETIGIDEVIAIGYGSVKKSDLTGSVGTVEVKTLTKAPVASFTDALAGRVAGLQVSSTDGQPGQNVNIVIRGSTTLTQDASPLYVIDGFPVESFDPSSLNPEEIESISVLKDASSTAIYGSRAANGVILVKTKRGLVSKPVITFNASMGVQRNPKKIDVMSPYEFVKYINELDPESPYALNYLIDKTLDDYRDVEGIDWFDQFTQTGQVQIYNLAIRGGTEETKYSISGSAYDQEGIIINTGLKRYNGRITFDQKISEKIKAGITANYSNVSSYGESVASLSSAGSISSTVLFRGWAYRPVDYDLSDDLLYEDVDEQAIYSSDVRVNPVISLKNAYDDKNSNLFESNGYIDYEILRGLTLKITGGIRRSNTERDIFYNSKTPQGNPRNVNNVNGIWGTISNSVSNSWSNEYILNYTKTFRNAHSLNGIVVYSQNKSKTQVNGYSSKNCPNESLGINGLDQGTAFNPVSNSNEGMMRSYATRWDYSYKSRYIFSGTFRADGSSKFSKKRRWGYFPGIAVAWNMEEENFFKVLFPFISNSKLRFSYGTNGNNRVGAYDRFAGITQKTSVSYSYNNGTPVTGAYISSVANNDLRWEKTTKLDIGYELGLFDKRLNLEFDLYRNKTTDLLLDADLPASSGFSSATKNIGSLRNDGMEFTLTTINVQNRSFRWTSAFNISFNRNKILSLANGQKTIETTPKFENNFGMLYLSEVGKPTGQMYGYIWEGNYQYSDYDNPAPDVYILKESMPAYGGVARSAVKPGNIKYKDLNGDGVVNSYDKTIIGRGQPVHIGGITNNFVYKQFSLNLFLQWSYGNNVYNANRITLEGNSNARPNMNQYASYVDRWSPENQTNKNFRAGGEGPIGYHSSRVAEDGSYLRLKTVSFEYSIPRNIIKILYMSDLSLNLAAQNLFTWTNYSGMDPDVSVRDQLLAPGFDFSAYPHARTVTLGIKATF